MSEKTQDAPKQKMKLSTLLEKVERIAFGADAQNRLPGQDGHDPQTAPDKWTLWIAGVIRIHLRRSIEHVIEFRKAIAHLQDAVKDLPTLREQVKEMTGLLTEIVRQIEAARGQTAPQEAAPPDTQQASATAPPTAPAPTAAVSDEEPEPTPEERARQAEVEKITELAMRGARENVVPIPPNANKKPPVAV